MAEENEVWCLGHAANTLSQALPPRYCVREVDSKSFGQSERDRSPSVAIVLLADLASQEFARLVELPQSPTIRIIGLLPDVSVGIEAHRVANCYAIAKSRLGRDSLRNDRRGFWQYVVSRTK